ncbi:MAG: DUF4338 domain-containing protein [Rubrivivax sp.]|nr:DUF4338 domain-containing protein [Rubrivivax sp.]
MSIYCGREFSAQDMQAIRHLIEYHPGVRRAALSRKLCELLDWRRPNGQLKDMTCRVALLRMQADGLITLPASRMSRPRSPAHFPPTPATDAQAALVQPVHELAALTLRPPPDTAASRLWNEYIARYHYLGYTPLSGSQLRYNVFAGQRLVALLSFGASAWKLAARERFIGWHDTQRRRNLQLVVNNARFLILPWVQSKGLASKILALAARQLPHDWHQRYGYRPVLLETFVESARHRGTCYKAANWTHVGQTTGRGKKCPVHEAVIPVKDIWLYPLRKDFRDALGR